MKATEEESARPCWTRVLHTDGDDDRDRDGGARVRPASAALGLRAMPLALTRARPLMFPPSAGVPSRQQGLKKSIFPSDSEGRRHGGGPRVGGGARTACCDPACSGEHVTGGGAEPRLPLTRHPPPPPNLASSNTLGFAHAMPGRLHQTHFTPVVFSAH